MPSANLPLFDSLARLVAELWPKFASKATTVALAIQGAIKPLFRDAIILTGPWYFIGFLVTLPDLCHYYLSIPNSLGILGFTLRSYTRYTNPFPVNSLQDPTLQLAFAVMLVL